MPSKADLVAEVEQLKAQLAGDLSEAADAELTTTVAELTAKNVALQAELDEANEGQEVANQLVGKLESEVATHVEEANERSMSMPEQISHWLLIANNRKVAAKDIFVLDVQKHVVNYRFAGSEDHFGIARQDNGDIAIPTPHEHQFIQPEGTGPARCRCGEPE